MSNSFLHPPKITDKSLRNTIFTDQQVFRWFLYLVESDAVRREAGQTDEVRAAYGRLATWRAAQRAVLAGVMAVIAAVILTQKYMLVWLLFPLWGALVMVERPLKEALHIISRSIIDRHFDKQTFTQRTLYQIGEHLAQHFGRGSLVDGIALTDALMRRWLVVLAFLVVFMFVMSFWRGMMMIFLLYFAGNIIINSGPVYRRYLK